MPGGLPRARGAAHAAWRAGCPGEVCAFSADSSTEKLRTSLIFFQAEGGSYPCLLSELLCAFPPHSSKASLALVRLVASFPQARDYGRASWGVHGAPQLGGLEELLELLTAQFGVSASAMGCCLVMVTGPSVAAQEEQGWDQRLSGRQGVPGAARAACTKALHTSSTTWGRAATAPAPEGRQRGRGHPRGIGLGFQQPFSTQLFEACMGAFGCLQHPLTLSFTLSLSSQLTARREKQNKLFLRDWSKAEREAGCGTSRAGHGAEAEPCPGTPTRRTVQDL